MFSSAVHKIQIKLTRQKNILELYNCDTAFSCDIQLWIVTDTADKMKWYRSKINVNSRDKSEVKYINRVYSHTLQAFLKRYV